MTTAKGMDGLTVVTTVKYSGLHWQRLSQELEGARVLRFESADDPELDKVLPEANVLILAADPDLKLLSAPRVSWIHADHAGLNKAARPEAFRSGLIVTGSAGRSAPVLAEHALFFALALAYRYPAFVDAQRAHQWGIPGQNDLRGLYGRTIGILGLGHTGKALAVRAKAFGMNVLGYDRTSHAELPPGVDQLFSLEAGDRIDPILAQSDFVVLALGLSDATYQLIGARELELIGPTGYLINMARGPIVDEEAMIHALYNGKIAGAGLDTFATEPLPSDSPLWDAPNTLITPHVTPQVPDRTGRSLEIICENIRRFKFGEPMLNQLIKEDIYTGPYVDKKSHGLHT